MANILKHSEIVELVDMPSAINAMRKIFTQHATNETTPTGLSHGSTKYGEFHIKSGGTHEYFATKINGGFFNNPKQGLPAIQGIILLSDGRTGKPLLIMDSSYTTGLRTAATTALAASYLAPPDARKIGVVGTGNQAKMHIQAMRQIYPKAEIILCSVLDLSHAESSSLRQKLTKEYGGGVYFWDNLKDVKEQCEILITCTPATSPFIMHSNASFIAAVGADSKGKREISEEVVENHTIVCDIVAQSFKVGEMQYFQHLDVGTWPLPFEENGDEFGSLGKVCLAGQNISSASRKFLFDSTGTALQDLAMAKMIYEKITSDKHPGRGTWIDLSL